VIQHCPKCNIKLTHREIEVGECDVCGASLAGGTLAAAVMPNHHAASQAANDDAPRPVRRTYGSGRAIEWAGARSGLTLMVAGSSMLTSAIVVLFLLMAAEPDGRGAALMGLVQLMGVVAVWGSIMVITAPFFGTGAPEESGAGKWAGFSAAFIVLGLLTLILGPTLAFQQRDPFDNFDRRDNDPRETMAIIGMVAQGLMMFATVFWCMFLRNTAAYLGRPALANAALLLLVLGALDHAAVVTLTTGADSLVRQSVDFPYWLFANLIVFGVAHIVLAGCVRGTVTRAIAK